MQIHSLRAIRHGEFMRNYTTLFADISDKNRLSTCGLKTKSNILCYFLNCYDGILLHWDLQVLIVELYISFKTKVVCWSIVSGSEFLERPLTLAYSYYPIPIYCINILRTFRYIVAFIEFKKQSLPNMQPFYFHYCFEYNTVKIEMHYSKLALWISRR